MLEPDTTLYKSLVDNDNSNDAEVVPPYQTFLQNNPSHSFTILDFLKMGCRVDGRSLYDHRKIVIKNNVIADAMGSAYIKQGKTKVVVAVYRPKEKTIKNENRTRGTLLCELKFAPSSCLKGKFPQQNILEKMYSQMLKKSLEPTICWDKTSNNQYTIHAVVINNEGSVLSAAVNAAGIAVSSAGIPMYDSIRCVSLISLGETEVLDPTFDEEISSLIGTEGDHTYLTMSYLQFRKQITHFHHFGSLSPTDITQNMMKLIDICHNMIPLANITTDIKRQSSATYPIFTVIYLNEMIKICQSEEEKIQEEIIDLTESSDDETVKFCGDNDAIEIIDLTDSNDSFGIFKNVNHN